MTVRQLALAPLVAARTLSAIAFPVDPTSTDTLGNEVVDTLNSASPGALINGTAQFPVACFP